MKERVEFSPHNCTSSVLLLCCCCKYYSRSQNETEIILRKTITNFWVTSVGLKYAPWLEHYKPSDCVKTVDSSTPPWIRYATCAVCWGWANLPCQWVKRLCWCGVYVTPAGTRALKWDSVAFCPISFVCITPDIFIFHFFCWGVPGTEVLRRDVGSRTKYSRYSSSVLRVQQRQ